MASKLAQRTLKTEVIWSSLLQENLKRMQKVSDGCFGCVDTDPAGGQATEVLICYCASQRKRSRGSTSNTLRNCSCRVTVCETRSEESRCVGAADRWKPASCCPTRSSDGECAQMHAGGITSPDPFAFSLCKTNPRQSQHCTFIHASSMWDTACTFSTCCPSCMQPLGVMMPNS